MNWEGCKYKNIAESISDSDIDSMISDMIQYYDSHGKFYKDYTADKYNFMKSHIKNSPDVLDMIEETANKIYDDLCKKYGEDYSMFSNIIIYEIDDRLYCLHELHEIGSYIKDDIYNNILRKVATEAKKQRAERVFKRLHRGEKVDFELCVNHLPFLGKIEFLKDGGWGIADENGIVIVKNHLKEQPSTTRRLYEHPFENNPPFKVVQDRDTELYGILDLDSFQEVIRCLYEEIEVDTFGRNNAMKHLIKVKKDYKWGCYDENGSFIIECKYNDIKTVYGTTWIECCRNEEDYGSLYNEKKDLYDTDGNILLGGYNSFEFYHAYLKFYFNTYPYYDERDKFIYTNYENATCLVVDKFFKTILKHNNLYKQIPFGTIFQSFQHLKNTIPNEYLLFGKVELEHYPKFIYLKRHKGNRCVDHEEHGDNDHHCLKDDEVTIIKIAEDGSFQWREKVNEIEIYQSYRGQHLYRIGDKVGLFSTNGISESMYSAITIYSQDGKMYVAKAGLTRQKFLYFEITDDGDLIELGSKSAFDPTKYRWFPKDFLKKNRLIYDDDYYDESMGSSYEKYGGYNGYDDDTIDYGFDGDPEATWNVD